LTQAAGEECSEARTDSGRSGIRRRNIILTGFMGTGKSSVGRSLARRLGREFVDLDELIVEKTGLSVTDIFGALGEEWFRRVEGEALKEVLGRDGRVVATGGGTFCSQGNAALMLERGVVIRLTAPPGEIFERVGGDGGRPLAVGGRSDFERLAAEREEWYRMAEWTVDTAGKGPAQVAEEITDMLDGHGR
jgi:shikimate kinase